MYVYVQEPNTEYGMYVYIQEHNTEYGMYVYIQEHNTEYGIYVYVQEHNTEYGMYKSMYVYVPNTEYGMYKSLTQLYCHDMQDAFDAHGPQKASCGAHPRARLLSGDRAFPRCCRYVVPFRSMDYAH